MLYGYDLIRRTMHHKYLPFDLTDNIYVSKVILLELDFGKELVLEETANRGNGTLQDNPLNKIPSSNIQNRICPQTKPPQNNLTKRFPNEGQHNLQILTYNLLSNLDIPTLTIPIIIKYQKLSHIF